MAAPPTGTLPKERDGVQAYLDSAAAGGIGIIGLVVALVFLLALYLLPLIIAIVRKAPDRAAVAVVNVLLGWTFVGWVVALAMACRSRSPVVYVPLYGSSAPTVVTAAPGWYPDPHGVARLRYFDGATWTAHTHD